MNKIWENILAEIALLAFLGFLYYIWQRRRILKDEKNKGPMVAGYILECCLVDRGEQTDPELDAIIEALDDYLNNRVATPPLAQLKHFSQTQICSPELKDIITEGLSVLEKN